MEIYSESTFNLGIMILATPKNPLAVRSFELIVGFDECGPHEKLNF